MVMPKSYDDFVSKLLAERQEAATPQAPSEFEGREIRGEIKFIGMDMASGPDMTARMTPEGPMIISAPKKRGRPKGSKNKDK